MATMTELLPRRTKIVATVGPSSWDPATLRGLIEAGADVLRLNFSHSDEEKHAEVVRDIRVSDVLRRYIVDLVRATREPGAVDSDLARSIEFGASPRASIALAAAARAHAFLDGRGYALPEDVKAIGPDVLRHRVLPTYEAEADGITAEDIVSRILDVVELP